MKIKDDKLKDLLARAHPGSSRGSCPDDVETAAFLDGALDEEGSERILAHLARCPECARAVLALREIMGAPRAEAAFRAPLSALERARKMDPAKKGVMEVVVRFAENAAEILRSSSGVTGEPVAAPEPVRGEDRVVSANLVCMVKPFPPFTAEVDVERVREDRGEVTIKLTEEETGLPARGLRVSLFDDEVETESAMVEDGQAVFENLEFGRYNLLITRVGEPLGRITLEMKGEGK